MKRVDLPTTLELYRETGKWILGLALGGFSGFIGVSGFSEKLSASPFWLKLVFVAGGVAVLIAVICGVCFVLYLAQFANALEKQHEPPDPKRTEAERAKLAKDLEKRKEDAKRAVGPCYLGLLLCFFASLFVFAFVGGCLLFAGPEPEPKITWSFDGEKVTGTLQPLNPIYPCTSDTRLSKLVELVKCANSRDGKRNPEKPSPSPSPTCTPVRRSIINIFSCPPVTPAPPQPTSCPGCRPQRHRKR
jgi:hypothetical protein